MKRIVIVALLSIMAGALFCHRATNAWELYQLKGKVKSMTDLGVYEQTRYSFDKKGVLIGKEVGDLREETKQYRSEESYQKYDYEYSYNKAKAIIGRKEMRGKEISFTETFEYDAQGVLIKSICIYPEAGYTYTTHYNSDGKESSSSRTTEGYDGKEEIVYEYGADPTQYKYSNYSDGMLMTVTVVKQDKDGLAQQFLVYDYDGVLLETTDIEYTKDASGNSTVITYRTVRDGSEDSYTYERSFEYYK